jgi:hypothetical protein
VKIGVEGGGRGKEEIIPFHLDVLKICPIRDFIVKYAKKNIKKSFAMAQGFFF